MTAIFMVSSFPRFVPATPGLTDKGEHAVAYGLLTVLLARALTGARLRAVTPRTLATAFAVTVLYGASDEWHQSFVVGRSAEMGDVVADAIGAVSAAGAIWAWSIITRFSALLGPHDPRASS